MEQIQRMLSGSGTFAVYFLASLALLAAFIALYSLVTSHSEMTLIRGGNKAAALSLAGAIAGFVIPMAKAVAQSVSLADMLVWAGIAFVAQVLAYGATALLVPHLRRSIANDHVASGILLAALSTATGILNAASMTV